MNRQLTIALVVSLALHLVVAAVLLVDWTTLFPPPAMPQPDQEATVDVVMGGSAEQTGSVGPSSPQAPPQPDTPATRPPPPPPEAAASPTPEPAPEPTDTPAAASPEPTPPQQTEQLPAPRPPALPKPAPTPPSWQISTLLGDGSVGATEIVGDQLRPAVGDRGNLPPGYPRASVQLGEQGLVVVRMHIAADGQVTEVEVLQSSGYDRLDNAARAALARWHFNPAVQDGQAVESFQDLPVRFRLY